MRRTGLARGAGLLLVASLLLTGCSDDEPAADEPTDPTTPSETSSEPTDDTDDDPDDDPDETDPDETTPDDDPDGTDDPDDGPGSDLLLAPVAGRLAVPDDRCRSVRAQGIFCSYDGAARYRVALDRSARVEVDEARPIRDTTSGAWVVDVRVDDGSAGALAGITRRLAGTDTQLAVVVADEILTAPVVQDPITGGEIRIAGAAFTERQARQIANRLD